MSTKEVIKHVLSEDNPFVIIRRNKMRRQLQNTTMTLLCPNCIGGILLHDLGLQFRSPTVNLMMIQVDFVKFVLHMDEYLKKEFEFFNHPEYCFPCAHLGDITIHFTHYKSKEEAVQKWKARAARINRDNMFVFLEERDGLTKSEILSLASLNVRGIVVFTAKPYPDIPYTLYLHKYKNDGEVGDILSKSLLNGKREYESYFDFVKWFNESNGGDFNVRPYSHRAF